MGSDAPYFGLLESFKPQQGILTDLFTSMRTLRPREVKAITQDLTNLSASRHTHLAASLTEEVELFLNGPSAGEQGSVPQEIYQDNRRWEGRGKRSLLPKRIREGPHIPLWGHRSGFSLPQGARFRLLSV